MKKALESAIKSGDVARVREILIQLASGTRGSIASVKDVTEAIEKTPGLFEPDDGMVYAPTARDLTQTQFDALARDLGSNFSPEKFDLYSQACEIRRKNPHYFEEHERLVKKTETYPAGNPPEKIVIEEEVVGDEIVAADVETVEGRDAKAAKGAGAAPHRKSAAATHHRGTAHVQKKETASAHTKRSSSHPGKRGVGEEIDEPAIDEAALLYSASVPDGEEDAGVYITDAEHLANPADVYDDTREAIESRQAAIRAEAAAREAVACDGEGYVDGNGEGSNFGRMPGYILLVLGLATAIVGICIPVMFLVGIGIGVLMLGAAVEYMGIPRG